jgi:hypothetical protein
MKRTTSIILFLALCLAALSCHPLKNTSQGFKNSIKSPKASSNFTLQAGNKFYGNFFFCGDGIISSTNVKGSYKIKRNKIYFYPEVYSSTNSNYSSDNIQREMPEKLAPELSPKVNGIFIVQDKVTYDAQHYNPNFIRGRKRKIEWLKFTAEQKEQFQQSHNYSTKQDSIWKLYDGEKEKYYECECLMSYDCKCP